MLTAERLREILDYDPNTGIFTRRVRTSNCVQIGDVAGGLCHNYLSVSVDGRRYLAHRLAWLYMYGELDPNLEIDHINGTPTDNRITNLRQVSSRTNKENRHCRRPDTKSGFLGVYPNGNHWQAKIVVKGCVKCLGTFVTPEEAHEAYLKAKRELHEGNTL